MSFEGRVPQNAFSGCSNMTSVILGETNMDDFEGCYVGSGISAIDDYAFYDCNKIRNVIIADREEELMLGSNGSNSLFSSCPLDSVYIGGNVSYSTDGNLGYSPFYRNTSLRTIHITDKETEISENEFYGCTNLQNVRIGDGVATIGNRSFSGCSSLKSFEFGKNVQSIGKEAFSDCTSVTDIISNANSPPVCGEQALDDINKWQCKLTVPKGRLTAYQAADQWKDFFFMEENTVIAHVSADDVQIRLENGLINVAGVGDGTNISVYSLSGQIISSAKAAGNQASLVTNLRKGDVFIVKIGEKTAKVIMQ